MLFRSSATGTPGGNVFGASDPAQRNTLSGMCLLSTLGTGSIPAAADRWSACSPTLQLSTTACDGAATTPYYDVWYVKNSSGCGTDPVAVTSCTLGP